MKAGGVTRPPPRATGGQRQSLWLGTPDLDRLWNQVTRLCCVSAIAGASLSSSQHLTSDEWRCIPTDQARRELPAPGAREADFLRTAVCLQCNEAGLIVAADTPTRRRWERECDKK